MSTTPLPPPELIFFDAALQSPLEGYTADQMQAYAQQARADLEAENARLREALESVHQWMGDQANAQSNGWHATFDLMMLREQRDIARAALENRA